MRTRLYLASAAPLGDAARFDRLLGTVHPARREKVAALKNPAARQLSLGAGLLLEFALRSHGLAAGEIRLNEYGKPFLPALPDFHFSLSHSAGHVLCAVSPAPVGCDLEGPRRCDLKIAERFFHPSETVWLRSLPEAEQSAAFLRLWTCKESYVKALGRGLSLPLDAFAVTLDGEALLTHTADGRPWRLRSFREGELFLALCGLAGVEDAPLEHVEFD